MGALSSVTQTSVGSRDGAAVTTPQCGPGSIPRLGVEFLGSLLCSERLFFGYSLFSKTIVYAKFGGQTKCMGNSKIENSGFPISS